MNYGELKTALTNWTKRSDLSSHYQTFVDQVQARLNTDVRVRGRIASATLSTVAGTESVALPSDWLRGLSLDIEGHGLEYRTPEELRAAYPSSFSGRPVVYSIEGDNLILGPKPDSVYSIRARYYQRFTAFAGDSSTDWVLTNYPNVYLFGCLVEAEAFAMDDNRSAVWEQRYQQAVNAMNRTEGSAASAGTTLRMRAK